jgi:hypothetical protein
MMASISQKKSLRNEPDADQSERQPRCHKFTGHEGISRVCGGQQKPTEREPNPSVIGIKNQRAEKIQMHQEN